MKDLLCLTSDAVPLVEVCNEMNVAPEYGLLASNVVHSLAVGLPEESNGRNGGAISSHLSRLCGKASKHPTLYEEIQVFGREFKCEGRNLLRPLTSFTVFADNEGRYNGFEITYNRNHKEPRDIAILDRNRDLVTKFFKKRRIKHLSYFFLPVPDEFADAYHRGFEGFRWPSTLTNPESAASADFDSFPALGVLGYVGYRVGKNGKSEEERREILRELFSSTQLPPVSEEELREAWGGSESAMRLRRIGESIARFCRGAKNQDHEFADYSEAISDWESDLAWLKREFYAGRFNTNFEWPQTLREHLAI
jgi:hypothetical protein